MSHTYTSCYKVTVPPLDAYSQRRGVRLRDACAPLDDLRDFSQLYLPAQLLAEQREQEAARRGEPPTYAPGWVLTAQEESQQLAAQRAYQMQGSSCAAAATATSAAPPAAAVPLSADELLNGTHASGTRRRHALHHAFRPLKGADGSTIFGVRYQRGLHQTRKGTLDADTLEPHAGASGGTSILDTPGAPWWMKTQPEGTLLPRSTTQSAYRGIPDEASLLDQEHFHSAFERSIPPTPMPAAVAASGRFGSLLAATAPSVRLRKLPLNSSHHPSLFFRIPDAKPHPQLHRNSALLREERRAAREAAAVEQQRLAMDRSKQNPEESKENGMMASVPSHSGSMTERARSSSSSGARPVARLPSMSGSLTARTMRPIAEHPSLPTHARAQADQPPLSAFEAHMARARLRWQQEALQAQQHDQAMRASNS